MSTTVGIDIAYDKIKLIGLAKSGSRFRLVGMNVVPIPANSWTTDELKNQEEIAKVLVEALISAKPHPIKAKNAMVALPESVVFSGTFSVPTLSAKELDQALPFQIAEKLSINLDDYYVDYEISAGSCQPLAEGEHRVSPPDGHKEKGAKKTGKAEPKITPVTETAVFAVAAKKTLVQSIIELCELAKLELAGIDIKPGAIARSIAGPKDKTTRIIIDLGASSTVMIVAAGQSTHLTSSIPIGTVAFAEQADGLGKFQAASGPIFDELVHVTKFYENRICPSEKIKEIVLTGGGANIKGIEEFFGKQTGLPVKFGAPFARVDRAHYPLDASLEQRFADAVGLAMRGSHG